MVRFKLNRRWAFISALAFFVLCLSCFTVQGPTTAYAVQITGEDPIIQSPSPGVGDPDVPITPSPPKPGKASIGAMQTLSAQRSVPQGEGLAPTSVVTMRLRVFFMFLRLRLLVF